MKKSRFLFLSLLIFSLVSCSGSDDIESDSIVRTFINSPIKTFDLSKASDVYSSEVLTQIMEGLTRAEVDSNGKAIIVPGIAESWEVSDDGLVWTFHLRDAAWSDGQPVTAEQFEYGIKRTLDPKTASVYAFILNPIKGAKKYNSGEGSVDEVGVKAIDSKTLQFTLSGPTAYFLDLTYFKTLFPQRKEIVEKYGDKNGSGFESVMSNGPFKMVSWVPNSKIELVKNENYWDAENVKLDGVSISIIQDPSAVMNSLFSGQIDMASVSKPEWIKKLDGTGKFNVIKGFTSGTNYTMYNLDDDIFKNDKVRKAFTLAIDRKEMTDVIFKGIFDPAYGWVPPETKIGDKDFRTEVKEPILKLQNENSDPKALLVEGLKELGLSGDPSEITIIYLNAGTGEWAREYFEYIQQLFITKLGVDVKGEFVEWPIFQSKLDNQEFQISGLSWVGDYNDPSTFFEPFHSQAGIYATGFKNARYDELLDLAGKTADQNKRLEYFKEAEEILLYKDNAISPTLYRKRNTYMNKRVRGVMLPAFSTADFKHAYISQ